MQRFIRFIGAAVGTSKSAGFPWWILVIAIAAVAVVVVAIVVIAHGSRSPEEYAHQRSGYKQDGDGAWAKNDLGQRVHVSNDTYAPSDSRTSATPYYFGGGGYGGSFFTPGYYADPFWNFVLLDQASDQSQGNAFDQGYEDGRADQQSDDQANDWTPDASPADTYGGEWNSDPTPDTPSNGGFGGGGDFGSPDSGGGGSSDGGSW